MDKAKLGNLKKEIKIPGGQGRAFEMNRGQLLKIIDVAGQQVADFIAFNKNNIAEKLSPTHTRTSLLSLKFYVGDQLRSNLRNPMFEVVEDTVGEHDFMIAACDERRYLVDYGVEDHRSCIANFEEILEPYGILRSNLPDPFNIFQSTTIDAAGKLIQLPSRSKPGDYLLLQAKMPVIGAVSACPMDLNPIGGDRISDILIRIYAGQKILASESLRLVQK
jgi:uncharacterized protein YcgI (DUF1989 family)